MCVVVGVFCLEEARERKEEKKSNTSKCLRCYETLNPKKEKCVCLSLSLSLSLSIETLYVCAFIRHSLTYALFIHTLFFFGTTARLTTTTTFCDACYDRALEKKKAFEQRRRGQSE